MGGLLSTEAAKGPSGYLRIGQTAICYRSAGEGEPTSRLPMPCSTGQYSLLSYSLFCQNK